MEDIRDKAVVTHEDVAALNFIRDAGGYYFRRHHMNGLRSHVMEVLRAADVGKEREGVTVNGIRLFPRAVPVRMLRIFRRKFHAFEEIIHEIARFKAVERYLTPAHVALSEEIIADYRAAAGTEPVLCGLQQYVRGEALDPWTTMDRGYLLHLTRSAIGPDRGDAGESEDVLRAKIRSGVEDFVGRIKKMVHETGLIPDLAGVRNILVTPAGEVKLVDINNISRITSDRCVLVDDFGYPVCDKSIQALALMEEKILEKTVDRADPVYRMFFDPGRMKAVEQLDRGFHQNRDPESR